MNRLVMIDKSLFEEKVGYDYANKKMIVRVYDALKEMLESQTDLKKNWTNVIRYMFVSEKREKDLRNINVNGYYSTIRTILKDIGVIEYKNRELIKGRNWDRFYSDEDWSWFITNTNCGGYGEIIK